MPGIRKDISKLQGQLDVITELSNPDIKRVSSSIILRHHFAASFCSCDAFGRGKRRVKVRIALPVINYRCYSSLYTCQLATFHFLEKFQPDRIERPVCVLSSALVLLSSTSRDIEY
jgi:hypothetical protein